MIPHLSAVQMAALIRNRQLSPVEATRAVLDHIERLQPALNCYITVCAEQALDAARAAEQAVMRGGVLGPLQGVPFSAEDLLDTQGVRTTCGSLIFEWNVPDRDDVAVARVKAAGGILVGKTTTSEFGQQGLTEAPLFGKTVNPWNSARTCGGSSGGSAVAVASGLAPLSLATDGGGPWTLTTDRGGSARIPAACNGVVGFKQSLGVVPVSTASDAFGNILYTTPMARNIEDTALMLDVMAGPHPSDPHSMGRPQRAFRAAVAAARDLRGVRIAWRPLLGNTVLAANVREVCEQAVKTLAQWGAEVFEPQDAFYDGLEVWSKVESSHRLVNYGHFLRTQRTRMDPTLVAQLDRAGELDNRSRCYAIFLRRQLYDRVQAWFEQADIVVTPTLARTALPIEHRDRDKVVIDGVPVDTMHRAWYPYTAPFNLTGNPALSLPCGFADDGLPVGLQLVGRLHEDELLLQAAALFERARPEVVAARPVWQGQEI